MLYKYHSRSENPGARIGGLQKFSTLSFSVFSDSDLLYGPN